MQSRTAQIALTALLIAVFITLRVLKMGETCLWFDEIFSVHAASQPWNSILSFIALDLIHPPLFYLLLKAWIAIGGDGLHWMRTLPVALSVFAILPLLLLLNELKQNFKCRLIVLLFLVFSGSILKYSLEVRMYSLMLVLGLFSIWLFIRYAERRTSIVPLVAINILLVYSHYFGWFVIASELIVAAAFYRTSLKKVCAMAAVTALAFTPWMVAVWNAASTGSGLSQNIGWMSRPGPREMTVFALNLIEPFYFQQGSTDPLSNFWVTVPLVILVIAVAVIGFVNRRSFDERVREVIFMLAVFGGVPVTAAFVVSWLSPYSIWGTRHLIMVFVPFLLIAAIIGVNLPGRTRRTALFASGVVLCLTGGVMTAVRETQQFAWCEAGPMTREARPGTPILAVEDLIAYHLWFEYRNDYPPRRIVKVENISGIDEDRAYFLPRGFDDVSRVDVDAITEPSFWLVHRGKSLMETEPPLRNFLHKGYRITEQKRIQASAEEVGTFLLEK